MENLLQRFLSNVKKTETCWLWKGRPSNQGYGAFWRYGKFVGAHRFSYEHFIGPIGPGLSVDHLCRVRMCVNPAHLEAVTVRENILRGIGLTAQNSRKTHCIRSHQLSGNNLYIAKNGSRHCRRCAANKSKAYRKTENGMRIAKKWATSEKHLAYLKKYRHDRAIAWRTYLGSKRINSAA